MLDNNQPKLLLLNWYTIPLCLVHGSINVAHESFTLGIQVQYLIMYSTS